MLLLLLAAAQAAPAPAPDIALDVRVHAREVKIEQRGETRLEVRANPDGGSQQHTDKPEAAGRQRLRDVDVRVQAEARIADPAQNAQPGETTRPQ